MDFPAEMLQDLLDILKQHPVFKMKSYPKGALAERVRALAALEDDLCLVLAPTLWLITAY